MEPGRTVFGRYEITGPLPDIGELERHAARDTHSGDEVEVIRPSALAALRPGARDRFRDAWDSAVGDRLPAARLPALATGGGYSCPGPSQCDAARKGRHPPSPHPPHRRTAGRGG